MATVASVAAKTPGRSGRKTRAEENAALSGVAPAKKAAPRLDYGPIVADFCEGVESGRIPAGSFVRQAIRRFQLDLEHGSRRGLEFDADLADGACNFFHRLRHSKGEFAGEPFVLRQFQAFIVWNLFGWLRADGTRRFREVYISYGKGNGKSPLAAAVAILTTFGEGEPRGEGYCYAVKRTNAKQLFDEILCQLKDSGIGHVHYRSTYTIEGPQQSEFKCMGQDVFDDGTVPQFVVRDELHRWQEYHRETFNGLQAGMGKRRQPMLFDITTAGDEESEILIERKAEFEQVLSQVENPPADDGWFGDEKFAYLAEIDAGEDVFDEANWPKANPMLLEPHSPVKIDFLRQQAELAKRGNITAEMRFRRFHANQQVHSTNKPITPEMWALGNDPLPENVAELESSVAFDLALRRDFAAVAAVTDLEDGRKGLEAWAWTVEERSEKLQSEAFLKLLRLPNVFIHPGNTIEYAQIREFLAQLNETRLVVAWSHDPRFATETSQWLFEEHAIECIVCPQTPQAYNEPTRSFLHAAETGQIVHGGCPLLAWCANNLVVRSDSKDLVMPSKDKSTNKIDPIVAGIMAWRESMFGEGDGSSYYEENELEVL